MIFLFFGALISSSSKIYDFKKESRQSELRDSVQHVQDSIRDLQVSRLINLTQSLNTFKDTSFENYTATSNSFKSNLEKLMVINNGVEDALHVMRSVKFPLDSLSIKFEFEEGVDSADFVKLAPLLLFIDRNEVKKNPKHYNLYNRDFLAEINTISDNPIYEARLDMRSKFFPDKEVIYRRAPDYKPFYKTRIFYNPNVFENIGVVKTNRIQSLDDLKDMKVFLVLQIWNLGEIPKLSRITLFYNKKPVSLIIWKQYQYEKSMLVIESAVTKRDVNWIHNLIGVK